MGEWGRGGWRGGGRRKYTHTEQNSTHIINEKEYVFFSRSFFHWKAAVTFIDWRMINRKESTKYLIKQMKQKGGGKKFKDYLKNNLTHPPNSSNL